MRAVIQNVRNASVKVADTTIGEIGPGMLTLLAVSAKDDQDDVHWLVRKISQLRLLSPDPDAPPRSLLDWPEAAILVISQFTLLASTRKGTRPSWHRAADPDRAREIYENFVHHLSTSLQRPVATGAFGEHMEVQCLNAGPITVVLDSHLRE